MAEAARRPEPLRCRTCESEIGPAMLACPACGWLVHGDRLRELADTAERATTAQSVTDALAARREAVELLPPGSRQHAATVDRMQALSLRIDAETTTARHAAPGWVRGGGPLAAFALLLWKFKVVLAVALGKGKLLVLGLTKATTLLSMLASFGLYWSEWGWRFAAGLIASMYVHEMGHVDRLRRFGIGASAPMFIPGFGAMVRATQRPVDAREDARVGLAGPLWGLGAGVVAFALHVATGWASFAAVARTGAWLNLFNLLPVWPLDGRRGLHALARPGRLLVAAAFAAMWAITREGLLLLLLVVTIGRMLEPPGVATSDRGALAEFVGLVIALSLLSALPVAMDAAG
jgi:Zn-dependent protease